MKKKEGQREGRKGRRRVDSWRRLVLRESFPFVFLFVFLTSSWSCCFVILNINIFVFLLYSKIILSEIN